MISTSVDEFGILVFVDRVGVVVAVLPLFLRLGDELVGRLLVGNAAFLVAALATTLLHAGIDVGVGANPELTMIWADDLDFGVGVCVLHAGVVVLLTVGLAGSGE